MVTNVLWVKEWGIKIINCHQLGTCEVVFCRHTTNEQPHSIFIYLFNGTGQLCDVYSLSMARTLSTIYIVQHDNKAMNIYTTIIFGKTLLMFLESTTVDGLALKYQVFGRFVILCFYFFICKLRPRHPPIIHPSWPSEMELVYHLSGVLL